ncbi:MAG: hypothetical protein ACRET4_01095 [Steroidobacteraceae bacterium]
MGWVLVVSVLAGCGTQAKHVRCDGHLVPVNAVAPASKPPMLAKPEPKASP